MPPNALAPEGPSTSSQPCDVVGEDYKVRVDFSASGILWPNRQMPNKTTTGAVVALYNAWFLFIRGNTDVRK